MSKYFNILAVFCVLVFCDNVANATTINMTTGTATTTVSSGDVFYDNGGSGSNYSNSINYAQQTLTASSGGIQVSFTSFNLEDGYDFLYVFDGTSTSANLIGIYSGTSPTTITGTTNSLTFVMYSDAATTYSGWAANITTGVAYASYNAFIGDHGGATQGYVTTSCSGTLYDEAGPSNYPDYTDNTLTINTGSGTTINMVFTSFSTESASCATDYDWLKIYNNTSTASGLIGCYSSGYTTPPNPVSATSGAMTLHFKSDAATTSSGYAATWTSTVPPAGSITGNTTICGSTSETYSTTTVNNTSTYNWTVPTGATITSGQGTTTIHVTFGSSSGNVTVTPQSGCGVNGTSSSLAVTVVPAPTTQASSLTFSNIACSSMTVNWTNGNGSKRIVKCNISNSFTAPSNGTDPAASSTYGGGQQVVYNGTGSSVSITGLTAGVTYWFRVYEASCSGTNIKYLTTTATDNPLSHSTSPATPATPGTISGSATQCQNATGQGYSVAAVTNASTYTWAVPTGWTITSGTGTDAITVTTGNVGQNGNITVTAGNSCGTSAAQTLAVTVIAASTPDAGPDRYICGSTSSISMAASGTGTWTQISGAATTITNATSPTTTITGISSTGSYVYRWSAGCGGVYDDVVVTKQ